MSSPQPHRLTIFLDDGGVISNNEVRGPQWQRLVGEYLAPRLGGELAAWGEANRVVAAGIWQEYFRTLLGRVDADYAAYHRSSQLRWLREMCERVGVAAPADDAACLDLVERTAAFVTRRVRAAFPGVAAAIRTLHARGYRLHTASGEHSTDLDGYLEGMGVRGCFGRLYGPDLVNTLKEGPEYYARIFADAGVSPAEAVVVDDMPVAARWVTAAGARLVLVRPGGRVDTSPDGAVLVVDSLAELPDAIEGWR